MSRVDIGVHKDGLVHLSALSRTRVKDPHSAVKAGQIVKVKVLEVDEKCKRIALTMRLSDAPEKMGEKPQAAQRSPRDPRAQGKPVGGKPNNHAPAPAPMGGAMVAAFS